MKNIIQLQDDLRSVPLKNLIFYIQNPSGEVPSYLALSEIKRRKDMEQRANTQQPSSLSVAEELTAPRQNIGPEFDTPQTMLAAQKNAQASMMPTETMNQGVAGLPIPDQMFSNEGMATGGIVAFDDGGDVNYAGGGMVAFGPGGDVASKRYQAALEDSYLSPGSLYAGAKDLLGMPFQYRVAYDPTTDKYMSRRALEGNTPNLDKYRKAAELRKQGLLAEADTLEKAAASPQINRPGLAGLDTSTADPGMTFSRDEIANIYQSTVPPTKTKEPTETIPVKATQATADQEGLASLYAPLKDRSAEFDAVMKPTENMAETEMTRYQKMVGGLPNKEKLEALVQKYETGAAEQERTAPYLALAKAGFAMAGGKSPFAIQNLAEGAQAGLADYVQAKDRLEKLRDKQVDIQYKLDSAEYDRKKAAADFGFKSEQYQKTNNDAAKLKKVEYNINREEKNQENKIKAYEAESKNKYFKALSISAAKNSDYETFINLARDLPENYTKVKNEDGTERNVFNIKKVTQEYNSYRTSGASTSTTDKEFLEQYATQSIIDKDFKKKFPTAADYVLDQRARLSGANAPAANSAGFSNFRISK